MVIAKILEERPEYMERLHDGVQGNPSQSPSCQPALTNRHVSELRLQ